MSSKQLTMFETQAVERVPQKKSPILYILEQQKLRSRQDLLKLRVALDCAENITNYDRELLHNIYRDIILDTTMTSQWESRKMKTKERTFRIVNASGEVNDELTSVLETQWFYDWMDACLDSFLWGFSLIEFGELVNGEFLPFKVNNKIFPAITVVDRDNVKPELGLITKHSGDSEGISFDDRKYTDHLMFVGGKEHGLLLRCAKLLLCKANAIENWSEWAEVFGMDKRVGYTETQGDDRKAFIKALRDMGSNSYGVFTSRDKVEYLGTNRADAFRVYKEFLLYIDEQISKIVFGQDVVMNNTGHVVGQVGENQANMYGDHDARFIKNLVNKRLIPFMENLGFSFQGHKFDWGTAEKLSMGQRATIDLQIANMGFEHSIDYINKMYGVDVKKAEQVKQELQKKADSNLEK